MIITGKKFSKPSLSRVINGDVVISEEEKIEKFRLDKVLVEKYPDYNRNTLQTFIKSGYVTVNGKTTLKPNTLVEKMRPETLYEDENVIVLDKPAGLLSMAKGEYTAEPTLEDYGLLVHRLDRDTSGVVILGKNEETQRLLRKQFQDRKTHKTYYAVTCGVPAPEHAMIDVPLTRNLKRPTTFMPDPQGREAQTEYRVLRAGDRTALVELKPRTGRTHQLRVHMNHIRCPILGDPIYNPKGPKANRMYLHAASLEITIPGREHGERMTFTAELPEEFERAIK